ncbi:MAG: RNA 2',3'-cyclic phosphodiesterase [Gemmatimonadales bacterium]
MRLFIAVPLPEEPDRLVRSRLGRLRSLDWPVRWIKDEGLHLTLKFFGEVTSDRYESLVELLDLATQGTGPMVLTLDGIGAFPSAERPRVLHWGVQAGPDCELLQDRLERGGERLGFPPEGRPFRPHVTLGRVREGHRLPSGWWDQVGTDAPPTPFLADRVCLYESQLGPGGPVYTARREVRLG